MIILRRNIERESASGGESPTAAVLVTRDVQGDANLRIEDLPSAEVASLIFEGTPTHVAESYSVLRHWMETQGLVPAGPVREIYSRDLSELPPGIVYMEIQIPVRKKRP
jgi:effector-binding domain-containing protein